MNCIIIDDEPLARDEMECLIQEVSTLSIIGKFSNAITALDFIQNNKVDLIFLDIEMPMINGIEFAEKIQKNAMIIFTTAYNQYALKSYDFDAVDYILKPIDVNRLKKSIDKAVNYHHLLQNQKYINSIESNTNEYLFIKADRKFYKIMLADILFIEGLKDYVVIHTQQQKLITAMNLKTIHQKIDLDTFLRVSKSYIVNTNHITSFDNHTVYINENDIPMGEVYRNDFITKYSDGILNL